VPSRLFASDSQRVGNAIDVVEPGSDKRDLQNGFVIKAGSAQLVMIVSLNFGRVFCELHHEIEHDAIARFDGGCCVVALQRFDKFRIEGDATQKLCVRFNSIHTPIGDRDHGGDHLVLAA